MSGNVLVVDDEPEMRSLLLLELGALGYSADVAASANEALELLRSGSFEAVLTDVFMPGVNGTELCAKIAATSPDVPVIVMTAFGSMETAVAALRAGAFDFVTKPLDRQLLDIAVRRSIEHHRLAEQVRVLRHPVDPVEGFPDLLGSSAGMQRIRQQILRVAATSASVLISGESGVGKELAAREICRHSKRAGKPFVAVDCAALPAALFESELFGHERGAFTDARTARKGLFAEANGGTLFLDEIGEIPVEMQPKLLRVLETRRIRPVGADREVAVDVRVIAATNRELLECVADGTFREDLYYRINVIVLRLPALRDRGAEVLELAQHFVARHAHQHGKAVTGLTESAARQLLDYPWPGNVRELRNAMESAVVLAATERIGVDDLPEAIRGHRATGGPPSDTPAFLSLAELEKRHILQILRAVGGRKSRAAEILGLDRKTLYRKLQGYAEDASPES